MCYHFTTPLRRRPAHVFASAQARKLAAFAGSSFSTATRFAGLAPERRGIARLTVSLPRERESSMRSPYVGTRAKKNARDWDVSQSRRLWGG